MQNARQPSHIDMDAYTTRSWRIGMDMPPPPDAYYVVNQTAVITQLPDARSSKACTSKGITKYED